MAGGKGRIAAKLSEQFVVEDIPEGVIDHGISIRIPSNTVDTLIVSTQDGRGVEKLEGRCVSGKMVRSISNTQWTEKPLIDESLWSYEDSPAIFASSQLASPDGEVAPLPIISNSADAVCFMAAADGVVMDLTALCGASFNRSLMTQFYVTGSLVEVPRAPRDGRASRLPQFVVRLPSNAPRWSN